MFELSFPEFVLCAIIGLLVLGPKRLPKVAAEIGKWVGRARRTASQLRRQLEREIELSELETPPPRTTPRAATPAQSATDTPAQPEPAPPPEGAPEPTIAPQAKPSEDGDSHDRRDAAREQLETTHASRD